MPENATPWIKVLPPQDAKAKRTEVLIYDRIGKDFWDESGVTFKCFREAWNAIPPDHEIDLRINSPGGSIWDGLPIHDLVAQRRERVTAHVEGVAASIASVIPMAAKRIVMPARGELFIHEPWTGAQGDAEVMRNAADRLEFLAGQIAGIYASKSGKTKEEMREKMKAGGIGTSFFGVQAKDAGLVDEITDTEPMKNSFDLSRFRPAVAPTGGTTPPPVQSKQTDTMSAEIKTPVAEVTPTPPVNRNPEAPDLSADFARLRAELDAERTKLQSAVNAERENRLGRELNLIAAEHEGVDPKVWLPRAMADESVISDLRKLPSRNTGAVGGSVTNQGNPLVEAYNTMERGRKRMEFAAANHLDLARELGRIQGPRGDNTISATLVPGYLTDAVIDVLTHRLAMVNAFTTRFSQDPMRPRATVLVPKITVGSTTQSNPANWETGDTTAVAVSVAVNQLGNSFHVTNDQLQQGHDLMKFSIAAANNLANAVSDAITALIVVGTTGENGFGTVVPIDSAANFAVEDIATIYAAGRDFATRNLLLDASYLGKLIPLNREMFSVGEAGAFGFQGIYEQNRWTGAVTNTIGFLCDLSAIAVASGFALSAPAGQFISDQVTTLKNGLSVSTKVWYNTATRVTWAAHDLMFGAAVGDGGANGAGKILSSAAPTP